MTFVVATVLFVVVIGILDARLRWPKPDDRTPQYVSIAERSKTLRRD